MENDKTQGPQPRANLDERGMDLIFRDARTYNAFLPDPVSDETLRAIYDLLKWGPTSANTSPMRVVFVRSKEAKDLLCTALFPSNVPKTMSAPVTAIVAHDTRFAEHLPKLFPHNPGIAAIFKDEEFSKATAFRNGSLQGAYLIIAARAFGLDCGPMSGFDNAKVDAAFFPDGRFKSNFLVNLGHGDPKSIFPRSPRLDFEEACEIR